MQTNGIWMPMGPMGHLSISYKTIWLLLIREKYGIEMCLSSCFSHSQQEWLHICYYWYFGWRFFFLDCKVLQHTTKRMIWLYQTKTNTPPWSKSLFTIGALTVKIDKRKYRAMNLSEMFVGWSCLLYENNELRM